MSRKISIGFFPTVCSESTVAYNRFDPSIIMRKIIPRHFKKWNKATVVFLCFIFKLKFVSKFMYTPGMAIHKINPENIMSSANLLSKSSHRDSRLLRRSVTVETWSFYLAGSKSARSLYIIQYTHWILVNYSTSCLSYLSCRSTILKYKLNPLFKPITC